MKHRLLEPFAAGAGFELRAYDVAEERAVADDLVVASDGSVLIVDGVFLLRAELYACWELKVYLRVSRATSIDRGVARDEVRSGDAILERRLYDERYAPAQERYLEEASPEASADVVIDNEDAKGSVIVHDTRRIAADPDH
jgi:uridine kinase